MARIYLVVVIFAALWLNSLAQLLDISKSKVKDCTLHSQPGDTCIARVKDLSPTQFGVGMQEVYCKTKRFEDMSTKELDEYLKDHPIPIIIGPSGFYMEDHHHLARSLYDADIDDSLKDVYCEVEFNWKAMENGDDFWHQMVTFGKVWLYDQHGNQPMSPEYLPTNVAEMLDDPLRSLSWMVRNEGGFGKSDDSYSEFLWANFFRANIPKKATPPRANNSTTWDWCNVRPYSEACFPDQIKWLAQALPVAMKLSQSHAAANLPGYKKGEIDPPNCG